MQRRPGGRRASSASVSPAARAFFLDAYVRFVATYRAPSRSHEDEVMTGWWEPTAAMQQLSWLLDGLAGRWPEILDFEAILAPAFAAQVPPPRFRTVTRERSAALAPIVVTGVDGDTATALGCGDGVGVARSGEHPGVFGQQIDTTVLRGDGAEQLRDRLFVAHVGRNGSQRAG